jgi:hypothetical protein
MIMSTLGLDNIAVAFALGPLQLGTRRTLQLGLAFGLAEAGMTLLGSMLGQTWLAAAMTTEMVRAGVLAALGLAVLGLVWVKTRPVGFVANADLGRPRAASRRRQSGRRCRSGVGRPFILADCG